MKKLLSLLLVPLLLLCSFTPALGADYRQIAGTYLNEKYGAKGVFEIFEGGIMELEFTKESFWCAKYIIYTDGKPTDNPNGSTRLPISVQEPTRTPAPDSTTKAEPALTPQTTPLMPQDIYYDYNIFGAIYIHLKTGKILEMDEMEKYYSAENKLAQEEWERLSKEAGKLDVNLYRKLQGMSASQKIKVSIQPTTVISDELKAAFISLKAKYPKIATEIDYELENLIGGYGVNGHSRVGFAVAEDLVASPDKAVSSGTMPATIDPARPSDKPLIIDPKYDEEYWKQMNAFWSEVEQLRQQSMAQSISAIEAALAQMGVEYSATVYAVIAELSVIQVKEIAQHSAVAAVYEEYDYSTMAPELFIGRGAAVDNKMLSLAVTEDAHVPPAASNQMPLFLGAVIALGGAVLLVVRRLV